MQSQFSLWQAGGRGQEQAGEGREEEQAARSGCQSGQRLLAMCIRSIFIYYWLKAASPASKQDAKGCRSHCVLRGGEEEEEVAADKPTA